MGETALIVEVPEAEPVVGPLRAAHDPSAHGGVPAHITVLYPFVPVRELESDVIDAVAKTVATISPFDFELTAVRTFPNAVWLLPAPEAPFIEVTQLLAAQFPECPPYGGQFSDVQPHLTIGKAAEVADVAPLAQTIRTAVRGALPIRCRARTLSLFAHHDDERWERLAAFALT